MKTMTKYLIIAIVTALSSGNALSAMNAAINAETNDTILGIHEDNELYILQGEFTAEEFNARYNPQIEQVTICENAIIGESGARALIAAIETGLPFLTFRGHVSGANSRNLILNAISSSQTLQGISWDNDISVINPLTNALRHNANLRFVVLNDITVDEARMLAEALRDNTTLIYLQIDNAISDEAKEILQNAARAELELVFE